MNNRHNRRALDRAEGGSRRVFRRDVSDWFKQRGEDFWHSVWKRIENGQSCNDRRRRIGEISREAPRDYAVDGEVRG